MDTLSANPGAGGSHGARHEDSNGYGLNVGYPQNLLSEAPQNWRIWRFIEWVHFAAFGQFFEELQLNFGMQFDLRPKYGNHIVTVLWLICYHVVNPKK